MTIAAKVLAELDRLTNNETPPNAVEIATWFALRLPSLRAALAPPQGKPAFWARLLNGELDDHSDYCVASDPNDLGDGDEEPGITIVPVYLDPPRIGNGIEPRGCPTPGACSCPASQPQAQAGEVDDWKAAAKYSADCHAAEAEREFSQPIATVVNNNQPHWTAIIETAPNVTLNVGTKLYLAPQPNNGRLNNAGDSINRNPVQTPGESPAQSAPECYEALRRILIEIDDADDTGRVAALDNIYGIAKAAYSAAPAQEPVAWRYKEVINCGQGQFFEQEDFSYSATQPFAMGGRRLTWVEPLYAAPPPDEARELLAELFDEWVDDDDQSELTQRIRAYLEKHK